MDKWKVIYFISSSGSNPVSDFLDSLDKQTQTKLLRVVGNIEEYGLLSVIPHIKKLSGTPFWEIRILGKSKDSEFKKAWEESEAEYQVSRVLIAARLTKKIS